MCIRNSEYFQELQLFKKTQNGQHMEKEVPDNTMKNYAFPDTSLVRYFLNTLYIRLAGSS